MSTWSFYDLKTGLFHSGTFTTGSAALDRAKREVEANTPAGFAGIEGRFDRHTQRVDLETGAVVAYERPEAEVQAEQRAAQAERARQRIAALELAQLRPLRELAVDPSNATAKQRLEQIDGEIGTLRESLK